MERKSCCCSGRSYVSTPKEKAAVVVTPKKEENVKPQVSVKNEATVQAAAGVMKGAKAEEKNTVTVDKQEPVKVNVVAGAGCSSFK